MYVSKGYSRSYIGIRFQINAKCYILESPLAQLNVKHCLIERQK